MDKPSRFTAFLHFAACFAPVCLSALPELWYEQPIERRVNGVRVEFNDLASDGEVFLAVGGRGSVLESRDGFVWEDVSFEDDPFPPDFFGVAYGDGTWVILTRFDAYTSQNRRDWTRHRDALPTGGNIITPRKTYHLNGYFIMEDRVTHMYSMDGVEWRNGRHRIRHIAHGNDRFLGFDVLDGFFHSPNLMAWALVNNEANIAPSDMMFAKGRFISTGYSTEPGNQESAIHTSTDGVRWERASIQSVAERLPSLLKSIYGNGYCMAIGGDMLILASVDGEVWEEVFTQRFYFPLAAAYGNRTFVILSQHTLFVGETSLEPPSGLSVHSVPGDAGKIRLQWNSVANAESYRIYMSGGGGEPSFYRDTADLDWVMDRPSLEETRFWVKSVNETDESSLSGPVSFIREPVFPVNPWDSLPTGAGGQKQAGIGWIHDGEFPYIYHFGSASWYMVLPKSVLPDLFLYDFRRDIFLWTSEEAGGWYFNVSNTSSGYHGWNRWADF